MRIIKELVEFNWLLKNIDPTTERLVKQDIPLTPIPMPEKIGVGEYEGWFLTNGIAIYKSSYRFNPKIRGQLIPLVTVSFKFSEPTLMIQTLVNGRVIHKDQLASNDLIYGDGVDLFRFCEEASVTPILDTSSSIEMVSMMIGYKSLSELIGESLANQLIEKLELTPMPKVNVRFMPNHINNSLQNCLRSEYTSTLKKVAAQARVLDYLSDITKYICEDLNKKEDSSRNAKKRIKELRQYLIELEGKLPTISSLATQFGRSARLLNEEFRQEYGDSIFSFVVKHRLNAAHEAIANSEIPLKKLAQKLGYAHVNHFSAAFKKNFGYSPGSLRKQ